MTISEFINNLLTHTTSPDAKLYMNGIPVERVRWKYTANDDEEVSCTEIEFFNGDIFQKLIEECKTIDDDN